MIAPQNASGVVLDSPASSSLQLLLFCQNVTVFGQLLFLFMTHLQKAHIDIQNMDQFSLEDLSQTAYRVRFLRSLCTWKGYMNSLYPSLLHKAFFTLNFSMHLVQVQFTMKLTHRTLPKNDDDYMPEFEPESEDAKLSTGARGKVVYRLDWDDDCPWNEWYSVEDSLTGFDLISIWPERTN